MTNKKGMTLVELLVSMTIFSVVLLVAVGGFISMNRLRAVGLTARETQQKMRISIEMISRYARQAEKVVLSNNASYPITAKNKKFFSDVEMYFDIANNPKAVKFSVFSNKMRVHKCISSLTPGDPICSTWDTGSDMFSGPVTLNWNGGHSSGFKKNSEVDLRSPQTDVTVALPASLLIDISGSVNVGNYFYDTDFELDTRVILENLK